MWCSTLANAAADCPDCDPPDSRHPWTWVESCHVERSHRLTDFGTFGSLLATGDAQVITSQPDAGRNRTGYSYIATVKQDLWSGGEFITYVEGGTSRTLDPLIGDQLGTNGLALPADFYVSRVFLLQNWSAQHIQMAVGRVGLSDFFDTNREANCEQTQFLAGNLVNNPTIPFPQAGIGAAARLSLTPSLFLQAGAGDARAVATESDFDTAFHADNLFSILEFGVSPFPKEHPGTCRFLLWHNPSSDSSEDNHGFAVSFDQSPTDDLTLFFRYDSADAPVNGFSNFWSFGGHVANPLPGRQNDSFRFGLALGDAARRTETLAEINYRWQVNNDLAITPLMQIVCNPVDRPHDETFVILGLLAVYVF